MTTQQKINHIQALYKDWLEVQKRLENAKKDLQKSTELIKELKGFYFDGDWQDIYEKIENGADFDLTTDGEYSTMGEDTLWNAFYEQQQMLWWYFGFIFRELEKDNTDFDNA